MKDNVFLILGGDNRSLYLGEYLTKKGLTVKYFGFDNIKNFESLDEALKSSNIIILPLPLSRDGSTLNAPLFKNEIMLDSVSSKLNNKAYVFGGKLTKDFCEKLDSKSIFYCDYIKLESLAIYNAVPTAEGTVGILIDSLPTTIRNMNVAILGYGKVGKALGNILYSMGAKVTIFARSESAVADAITKNLNGRSFSLLSEQNNNYDVLINTVPQKVVNKEALKKLNPECVLIELASAPFGIDFQAAKELSFNVIKASSLPAKAAPKTAGEIIGQCILPILKARGLFT